VNIHQPLNAATHRYPTFIVTLYPFICTVRKGSITLHEHVALSWLTVDQLPSLDWTAADIPVLAEYRALAHARMR
jgi:8-oxo-dGTP diphosphatase